MTASNRTLPRILALAAIIGLGAPFFAAGVAWSSGFDPQALACRLPVASQDQAGLRALLDRELVDGAGNQRALLVRLIALTERLYREAGHREQIDPDDQWPNQGFGSLLISYLTHLKQRGRTGSIAEALGIWDALEGVPTEEIFADNRRMLFGQPSRYPIPARRAAPPVAPAAPAVVAAAPEPLPVAPPAPRSPAAPVATVPPTLPPRPAPAPAARLEPSSDARAIVEHLASSMTAGLTQSELHSLAFTLETSHGARLRHLWQELSASSDRRGMRDQSLELVARVVEARLFGDLVEELFYEHRTRRGLGEFFAAYGSGDAYPAMLRAMEQDPSAVAAEIRRSIGRVAPAAAAVAPEPGALSERERAQLERLRDLLNRTLGQTDLRVLASVLASDLPGLEARVPPGESVGGKIDRILKYAEACDKLPELFAGVRDFFESEGRGYQYPGDLAL